MADEVTPQAVYDNRRAFLKKAGLFAATSAVWGGGLIALSTRGRADPPPLPPAPPVSGDAEADPWRRIAEPSPFDTGEPATAFGDITTYNNFYEFGLSKSDPAEHARDFVARPWALHIDGMVHDPLTIDVDDLIRRFGLEERIYRMRCVEAWSMVIPWVGFALHKLIDLAKPTAAAKYVKFKTLLDPERMPGQRRPVLPWPYEEALRIDEATHPLAFMAVGLYGAPLLGQNGAPLRLVVPWKYGFKGIKSIVEIWFTDRQPRTTWNIVQPSEYGFYANVNPDVPHPRWSQASERRIGQSERIPTQLFNGYAEQVAHLYRGLDLTTNF